MIVPALCRAVIALECRTGHWLCDPPSWTAHVGRRWRPFDEEPLNLFNLWWSIGQRILAHEVTT